MFYWMVYLLRFFILKNTWAKVMKKQIGWYADPSFFVKLVLFSSFLTIFEAYFLSISPF